MLSVLSVLGLAWAVSAASQCPQGNVPQNITGQTLRIAAVGDSITVGITSSTYDGYRRQLVNMLDGNQVNMIGYHTSGQGRDTQVHAQSGDYVASIQDKINMTFSSNPNVYLIHAGSNNIYWTSDKCNSGATVCQDTTNLLETLIDTIHNATQGQALIVVAQVIPGYNTSTANPGYFNNTQNYGADILKMVRKKDYPGTPYKIQLVNMQDPKIGLSATADITSDGLHPNDSGYAKMAQIWYNGIVNASYCGNLPAIQPAAGYITKPCSVPFSNNYTDGIIVQPRGTINTWAPLSCSETASGTTCNCKDDGPNNFTVPRTGNCREMSIGFTSSNRWADLNGDGRQENIWVGNTGLLNISLNLGGPTNAANNSLTLQSRYRELGGFGLFAPSGVNAKRYQVALADLDGDARAEYMVIDPTGNITGYWNQGSMGTLDGDISIHWGGPNTTSATKGVSGIGVRLVDWDGDGRADYVWVGADAEVQVWLNGGTTAGTATVNNWVAQGSGYIGPSVPSGSTREQVVFADINADGRADYLLVDRSNTATNGQVTAWLNLPPSFGSFSPNWKSLGIIVTAAQGQSVGSNGFLNEVQFADPDGDGAYDYVVAGGGDSSVQGWRNGCIPWSGPYN